MPRLLLCAAFVAGCGGPTDRCRDVKCVEGQICDPPSGLCVPAAPPDVAALPPDLSAGDAGGSDLSIADSGPGSDAPPPDLAVNLDFASASDLALGADLSSPEVDLRLGVDLASTDLGAPFGCGRPVALSFINDTATATGDTAKGVSLSSSVGCGGGGPEIVHVFELKQARNVIVTVVPDPNSPAYQPVVYLRNACDLAQVANEFACVDAGAPKTTAGFAAFAPPGLYFVVVDGFGATRGAFTLTVQLAPAPFPQGNDKCAGAVPLMVANNRAIAAGDLRGNNDDLVGSCGSKGADVVYLLTLKQPQLVTARLTPDKSTLGYRPVLLLRKSCAGMAMGEELACRAGGPGVVVTSRLALPAGTYYVWVDSVESASGKYTLEVELGPPPPANDSCLAPEKLTIANNQASANVDTTAAVDDATSGMCGGSGPDVVYTLTLQAAQQVTVTLTPDNASKLWEPMIALRTACGEGKAEIGCQSAGAGLPVKLVVPFVPAGTHFLWLDGLANSAGLGRLTVDLAPPQMPLDGESCLNPAPLKLVNNKATVSFDTQSARGDDSGLCGGLTSPDLVYSFTTNSDFKLTAVVTPDAMTPLYQPLLYVRQDQMGCAPAKELDCNRAAKAAAPAQLSLPISAGTYYVWVDGFADTKGKGSLAVTLDPAQLAKNENCASAAAISAGQPVASDTSAAVDDMGAKISQLCDVNAMGAFPGRDLVFVYTPVADRMAKLTLTPDMKYDAALWVMPALCKAAGDGCSQASDEIGAGKVETLTVAVKANTPYFIVVDAFSPAEAGPFTLQVQ